MSFRSAAYAVVAQIFKLIDSNGFTRVLFGPRTFPTPTNIDGYAFVYDDPTWTGSQEAGIAFGEDDPGTIVDAQSMIYAQDDTGQWFADTKSRVTDNAGKGSSSLLEAYQYGGVGSPSAAVNTAVSEPFGLASAISGMSATVQGVLGSAFVSVEADEATALTYIDMNADRFRYDGAGWQTYTMTIWQGAGTPNIAKNAFSTLGRWMRIGPIMFVRGVWQVTGVGTAGQTVVISLPTVFTPINLGSQLGTGAINDSSAALRYPGNMEHTVIPGFHGVILTSEATGFNSWGAVPAIALAANDSGTFHLMYECTG
jgi:hypothetical protein